jgi:hypothetical protein
MRVLVGKAKAPGTLELLPKSEVPPSQDPKSLQRRVGLK